MYFSSNEDIYKLVKSFEERTIEKREWTHAAHLTVGLYYMKRLPFAVARNVMRDGIHSLNDRHGTPNTDSSGYHETLTVFWLKQIWNFIDSRTDNDDLAALANGLIRNHKDSSQPLMFYSSELLFSAKARLDYYPPDIRVRPLIPFPVRLTILKPLV